METQFRIPPLTDRDFWGEVAVSPIYEPLRTPMRNILENTARYPSMPRATDYLAAKRSNDRGRVDRVWQEERSRLAALALNRCLRGVEEDDPDDRLLDWLWEFVTQPSWVVSAHLPGNDLPTSGDPQLDLAACEMAMEIAEMREALLPWMDSISRTLSESIVREIDRRVLEPYANGAYVWWDDAQRREVNNWAGVCAGSILAACESLAAQGFERPKARTRALDGLKIFLENGFTPDGECDEGIGYWNYGVGYACNGLQRLSDAALGEMVNLDRLKRVADYPRRVHLFGDTFFAGNDSSLHSSAPLFFVPWLARVCESGWLAAWAAKSGVPGARGFAPINRLIRALASPSSIRGQAIEEEFPRLLQDQQTGFFKVETTKGAIIACLSGGNNAERHNHNDLGHFLVAVNEKILVPDLGAPRYTADFFGPNRYQSLPASSLGHNCPIINGYPQRDGKDAAGEILSWSNDRSHPLLSLQLSAAYPIECGIQSWRRTMEGFESSVIISDDFSVNPNGKIAHVVWFTEKPVISVEDGRLSFVLGKMVCHVEGDVRSQIMEEINPEDHRLHSFGSHSLYRAEVLFLANENGEVAFTTNFEIV